MGFKREAASPTRSPFPIFWRQVDHPFVLKLEATFRDRDCLYMLLEYVQGGELFAFLANTKLGYVALDDAR